MDLAARLRLAAFAGAQVLMACPMSCNDMGRCSLGRGLVASFNRKRLRSSQATRKQSSFSQTAISGFAVTSATQRLCVLIKTSAFASMPAASDLALVVAVGGSVMQRYPGGRNSTEI